MLDNYDNLDSYVQDKQDNVWDYLTVITKDRLNHKTVTERISGERAMKKRFFGIIPNEGFFCLFMDAAYALDFFFEAFKKKKVGEDGEELESDAEKNYTDNSSSLRNMIVSSLKEYGEDCQCYAVLFNGVLCQVICNRKEEINKLYIPKWINKVKILYSDNPEDRFPIEFGVPNPNMDYKQQRKMEKDIEDWKSHVFKTDDTTRRTIESIPPSVKRMNMQKELEKPSTYSMTFYDGELSINDILR